MDLVASADFLFLPQIKERSLFPTGFPFVFRLFLSFGVKFVKSYLAIHKYGGDQIALFRV